jgi:hypothetical protein
LLHRLDLEFRDQHQSAEIRAELYIDSPQAKQEFALLHPRKEELEKALGFQLVWHNPEDKNIAKLYTKLDADWLDEKKWPQHFAWLKQRLEVMHRVFGPVMQQIRDELIR